MPKGRQDLLRPVDLMETHSSVIPSRFDAVPGHATEAIFHPAVTYNFWGRVQGMDYPSLSPAEQESFQAHFLRELTSLKNWCAQHQWFPSSSVSDLRVFVSD